MTRFAFPELKLIRRYLAAVIFTSIAASTSIGFAAEKINIYFHRQKVLIQPFPEFLTEEKTQHLYGEINFEYPVNLAVSVNGELASWGRFKPDSLPIERLAALAPKAQMIIDRVGW